MPLQENQRPTRTESSPATDLTFIQSGHSLPTNSNKNADLTAAGHTMNHLALFERYLIDALQNQVQGDLFTEPSAWYGATQGLVEGFTRWQLLQGYSVSSVNLRLSTVKTYCRLTARAGMIPRDEYAMICTVFGYRRAEARHIDEKREEVGLPTRRGAKKDEPIRLTRAQARQLRNEHPDTPQGRRDRLMMCLFIDLGLRCGEVASLQVADFDLSRGELVFYREKVDKVQTLSLSRAIRQAARAYLAGDALTLGPLLRSSRKSGDLTTAGVSQRNISERVRVLGERIGVQGLSAHDLRHYWATNAARGNTPLDRLQEAGGWSSPVRPLRYIEAAQIANEGVTFEEHLDDIPDTPS